MRYAVAGIAVCLIAGSAAAQARADDLAPAAPVQQAATQPARPAQWAQPLHVPGVPNLNRVSPTLYRSAQPTREGMEQLKAMGIKTVISLRTFHDDHDELEDVPGLQHFEIRMKAWHAEKEDALKFLKLATDPANQPVLVHCQHGSDRTGTMCALYRMAVQGWTKEQAVTEMTEGGFGFHEVWANLKRWLDTVDVGELRHEAGIQ